MAEFENWDEGDYPAQIWGFVDLTSLPDGIEVQLDDETVLSNNVYAIVESALYVEEGEPLSDFWIPVYFDETEVAADGTVVDRRYYVVDVETFSEPLCVIPNIGGPKTEFLMMRPRAKWSEDFIDWLNAPHKLDDEEMRAMAKKQAEEDAEDVEEAEDDEEAGAEEESSAGTDEEEEESDEE